MKFLMHFPQPITSHVRIDLCRADVGVPKQLLNDPQVCSVLQQMRREAMPQHMRCDVARNAGAARALLDPQPECHWRKRSATFGQEHVGRRARSQKFWPPGIEVSL